MSKRERFDQVDRNVHLDAILTNVNVATYHGCTFLPLKNCQNSGFKKRNQILGENIYMLLSTFICLMSIINYSL